jgi:hypothetical protein
MQESINIFYDHIISIPIAAFIVAVVLKGIILKITT